MNKTVDEELSGIKLDWDGRSCVCVVLASGGYPGNYERNLEIEGLGSLSNLEDVYVFYAGVKYVLASSIVPARFVTSGGRVLNVVALGDTIPEAQSRVYKTINNINFNNMHYRKDIGSKALRGGING